LTYSKAYKRLVTLLLMSVSTFNAMDRSIISIIGQSMKVDLRLSDTQLGLLSGTAFAVFYAFGGIPIARLAERFNRTNIIALALIAWSALTAMCGLATNFAQLLLTRVGVGVAESGCSPAAHSLISDYFEPDRRTSALSIYSCGISLGYILAAVVGGYVAQHHGWRLACAMVGLPGIVLAILMKVLLREPPRGNSEPTALGANTPPIPDGVNSRFSLRVELLELRAVAKTLLLKWPVLNMILGVTVGAFANYGFYGFMPPYLNRAFGLDYATIGIIAALTGGVAVGIGIAAGGLLADFLGRRNARWYALVPAIGTLIAAPFYLLTALQPDWRLAAVFLALAGFFQYASLGPTFGVVQNVVGIRQRATATALLYICLNVVALGGGPLFTGWMIDRFGQADPALTLAEATRSGLVLTLIFYAWASLHYFLAATGIGGVLRKAGAI
jgi:predicted MFS family arabinose efflux permease